MDAWCWLAPSQEHDGKHDDHDNNDCSEADKHGVTPLSLRRLAGRSCLIRLPRSPGQPGRPFLRVMWSSGGWPDRQEPGQPEHQMTQRHHRRDAGTNRARLPTRCSATRRPARNAQDSPGDFPAVPERAVLLAHSSSVPASSPGQADRDAALTRRSPLTEHCRESRPSSRAVRVPQVGR
jgi:hypothetical protein